MLSVLRKTNKNYNQSKTYKSELWVINKIRSWYNSNDIRINVEKGIIKVRFGYWCEVDLLELNSLVGRYCDIQEYNWEDDCCGWLYSYEFKLKS